MGVGVSLSGRPVLRDIDLTIAPREIVTVIGPNGSGKSTLLRRRIGASVPQTDDAVHRPGAQMGQVPRTGDGPDAAAERRAVPDAVPPGKRRGTQRCR